MDVGAKKQIQINILKNKSDRYLYFFKIQKVLKKL